MSTSFSKNQISKKSDKSPRNSVPINENNKNKSLIKSNEISLPHFNTTDSNFLSTMEKLVSNDKLIRENAAQKAKKYLHISYSNSEELYQKISRSLFYFFWNTDKPAYQLSMAKLIASFIYINPEEKNKLIPKNRIWISTFLSEMSKKFQSIDALRLDKYVMMIDQVMSTYLNACLENKFFKSVIYLVNYFIKESESNKNNFNFTFEANKIKVISRFIKLLLNSDDKIEGNLKNREEFLNNEESGFSVFYKKLLLFYKNMKDKREIKNFQENIFETILDGLNENKKKNKNLKLINKIEEINEKFKQEYKNEISEKKSLNFEFFLNKLKDDKYKNPLIDNKNKDKNVVDPVNDYIMKKKYLQKFKKSKEEIRKEKSEKNLNKNKNIKENSDKKDNNNLDEEGKSGNKSDKTEKSDKKEKSNKKEKLDKLKNIVDELNFDDIEVEKQVIDLNEENEEEKIEKKEKQLSSNTKNKLDISESIKKNKKNMINNKKESPNKNDMIKKEEQNEKLISKNKNKNKLPQKNSSSSGDDDCLLEDSDEVEESDEQLIEENDDDDSSENPSLSLNNSNSKNKENFGELYTDEMLDKYSKELMEEEEEEQEDDDEDYELDENDFDNLAEDMIGNYNDQKTLINTKLNMKQSLLNKKRMRNLKNERNDSKINNNNKKKKITFSLENNVLSLYNSKIPISLKSKKKNVFVSGATSRQSILKK